MNLTFVHAQESDLDLLFRLNQNLIDTYEDLSAIDYPKVLTWVRKNLAHNLPHFTRVLCDGTVAGFFCLTNEGEKQELDSLFVLPEYQNQGIGTAILRNCLKDIPVYLYVFNRNTRAIALYQRMGFRITRNVGTTRCIMEYTP